MAGLDQPVVVESPQDLPRLDDERVARELVRVRRAQVPAGLVLGVAGHTDPHHLEPLGPVLGLVEDVRQLSTRGLDTHPPDDLPRHVVAGVARAVLAHVDHVAVRAGRRVPLGLGERGGPVPLAAASYVDRPVLRAHVGLVVRVIGAHVAGVAGLGLARLDEAEGVPGVAGDAAVAVDEAARIDVFLLLLAPVLGVGRTGLRVARVAAHLHHLPRHLRVVRHPDVPLPVDAQVAGAGAVGMARVQHVLLVDLRMAAGAGRLGNPALGGHDPVVIGAVTVGARHRGSLLHTRVLGPRPAHRARFELANHGGMELAVAFRAGRGVQISARQVTTQPGDVAGQLLQILVDLLGVVLADDLLGKLGHDVAGVPQLSEERVERKRRGGKSRADAAAGARSMAPQTAPADIEPLAGEIVVVLLGAEIHRDRERADAERGTDRRPPAKPAPSPHRATPCRTARGPRRSSPPRSRPASTPAGRSGCGQRTG